MTYEPSNRALTLYAGYLINLGYDPIEIRRIPYRGTVAAFGIGFFNEIREEEFIRRFENWQGGTELEKKRKITLGNMCEFEI